LRLGVGMSTVLSLVPGLAEISRARPGVEIEVADMSTLDQIEALIAGRIDVASCACRLITLNWRSEKF